jgi:eukaryotic-like serine/threonine-protein kinase
MAAAVIVVLGVVALAVSNVLIRNEQARTQAANGQLKENLQLALQALDEVYFRLTEDRLTRDPKEQKADDELLNKALAFYERFAEQNSDDPGVRFEMSRAHSRAGAIHTALLRHARAKQAYGQSLALAEQLAADYPEEPKYRANLGQILMDMAGGLDNLGEHEETKAYSQRAFDLRKQLAAEYPKVIAYRQDLAYAYNFMGWSLFRRGEAAAAVPLYREGLDLQAQLVAEGLKSPASRSQLARVHVNLGAALARLDNPDSAKHYREQRLPGQLRVTEFCPGPDEPDRHRPCERRSAGRGE